MRACACGNRHIDASFVQMGGMPHDPAGQTRHTTLDHDPAAEITAARVGAIGSEVDARVIIKPQAAPSAITDCGGAHVGIEMTIIASRGYPTRIYEFGPQVTTYARRLTNRISHRFHVTEVHDAFQLALTPGAAKKAVATFGH